ncbi:hypothetical protein L1987_02769 [Smallanthus sonchifolius]|uniref:Uncharacterized protein n=1 Tax=Smallanthus sonchifolius TaxID=185202 RepID=A0ACB9K8M2_9ASTR|nr:hypothetical protein L1987_02769 [Smallanthus sonchifolius]
MISHVQTDGHVHDLHVDDYWFWDLSSMLLQQVLFNLDSTLILLLFSAYTGHQCLLLVKLLSLLSFADCLVQSYHVSVIQVILDLEVEHIPQKSFNRLYASQSLDPNFITCGFRFVFLSHLILFPILFYSLLNIGVKLGILINHLLS